VRAALLKVAQGWTPAHFAAQYGIPDAFDYLRSRERRIDAQAKDGATPLMVACLNGQTDAAAKLLALNHQFNVTDTMHETALHKAVRRDSALICRLLNAVGIDTTIRNSAGDTAADLARRLGYNDLQDSLTTVSVSGASPTLLRKFLSNRDSLSIRDLLKRDKSLASHRYAKDWTPLHFAAFEGDAESAAILLDNGAQVDAKNGNGTTALMLAVQEGKTDVVQLLLARKASVAAKDKQGWTPLHFAAQENRLEIARELVRAGAAKNAKDAKGRTPFDVATKMGRAEIAHALK
jgi:ankyrin repeat protein